MARLVTCGWEIQDAGSSTVGRGEGQNYSTSGTAPVIDTATVRSGAASLKVTSTRQALWSSLAIPQGTICYGRAYVNLSALPAAATLVIGFQAAAGGALVRAEILSTGEIRLFNAAQSVQIGSNGPVLNLSQWYRIELSCKIGSGATSDNAELLLDGVSIASLVGGNISDSIIQQFVLGSTTASTMTVFFDDVAINDSTGGSQNGYPGAGKIVMLKPVNDNARVGWTGGALGTTNLWDAVNNTPPVGAADVSATNTSQIRDALANTTDTYDANLAAYTDSVTSGGGGLGTSDTVTLVQPMANFGPVTAAACQLGQQMLSNPAIAELVPAATAATAVGAYPTGWNAQRGTVTYSPAPTLATQPVMRVRKATSAVAEDVDQMGLYVEYIPAPTPPPIKVINQAIQRSSVW